MNNEAIPEFLLNWINNKNYDAIIDFLDNENNLTVDFYINLLHLYKNLEDKVLVALLIKINYLLKKNI
jgi:hypothetical protein